MRAAIHRTEEPLTHVAVAERIKQMLRNERWTGRSAAVRLGWTVTYLSRRLNGEVPFDVPDLLAIARLLEVEPGAFFEDPNLHTPD